MTYHTIDLAETVLIVEDGWVSDGYIVINTRHPLAPEIKVVRGTKIAHSSRRKMDESLAAGGFAIMGEQSMGSDSYRGVIFLILQKLYDGVLSVGSTDGITIKLVDQWGHVQALIPFKHFALCAHCRFRRSANGLVQAQDDQGIMAIIAPME